MRSLKSLDLIPLSRKQVATVDRCRGFPYEPVLLGETACDYFIVVLLLMLPYAQTDGGDLPAHRVRRIVVAHAFGAQSIVIASQAAVPS